MTKKLCAAVTMAYNEPHFLPIWAKYYGHAFGERQCYVIDHGSDDGSTAAIGDVNVVHIPRSPMHDLKRANFVSNFVNSLLEWYDVVLYTDIDEILVADPERFADLTSLCAQTELPVVTALGFNLHQVSEEQPVDAHAPILGQRRWARFSFAMCKPLVTRVPIRWVPGFHTSDQPMAFDGLFLFHLHDYDNETLLSRLAKTREMPWGDGPEDHYQRWSDEKYKNMVDSICQYFTRHSDVTLRGDDPFLLSKLDWMRKFIVENPDKAAHFYLHGNPMTYDLVRVPDRFSGIF